MIVYLSLFIVFVMVGYTAQDEGDTQPLLVFCNYGTKSVVSVPVSGGNITSEIPDGSIEDPQDIVYDNVNNIIYVLDKENATVSSFTLGDPDSLQTVINLPDGVYWGIAHDRVNNQLFVTESRTDTIYRLSTNGTGFEDWASADSTHDVDIHSDLGFVYWTEYWNGRVVRAPVTDPTGLLVIASGIAQPYGLYIDEYFDKVYWCGIHCVKLEESSLDGGNRKTVVELPSDITTYYLAGINGHLYISSLNWSGHHILDVYNGSYTKLQLEEEISALGILAIQNIYTETDLVTSTTNLIQQDTSYTASTSILVQQEASSFDMTSVLDDTDTTSLLTTTKIQAEVAPLPNTQQLGWMIGGVLITIVICATIIAVVIIITKHRRRVENNDKAEKNSNTTTALPGMAESDNVHDQHRSTHHQQLNIDPEYMEIPDDKPETPNTDARNYQNLSDNKEIPDDKPETPTTDDRNYQNLSDNKESNKYEMSTPGERNTYIAPYSTLKTDTEYESTAPGQRNTYMAPYSTINSDTSYQPSVPGQRDTYIAPYTTVTSNNTVEY